MGAEVQARWWCHDNPLPDGPGSFFVKTSTVTDNRGEFRLEKETRRGGLFGSSFALEATAQGYLPAVVFIEPSSNPLPASTESYPFRTVAQFTQVPSRYQLKLKPAVPVYLKALRDGVPGHMRQAREALRKLLEVDYGYNADAWEEAVKSPTNRALNYATKEPPAESRGCDCPESIRKFKRPREYRKRLRKLLKAAALDDMEEAERLIESGVDVRDRNYGCRTALSEASSMGRLAMVKFLLSKGAQANTRDKNCRTPLMGAAYNYRGQEVVALLLSHGAEVNAQDNRGRTALMQAAKEGYTGTVRILVANGADVNATDRSGETALMGAASFGHLDTVKILLSRGADVNARDKEGETAWFKAAALSYKEVMQLLEQHGAKR